MEVSANGEPRKVNEKPYATVGHTAVVVFGLDRDFVDFH